eukprot:TRINITY_DN14289_c0_g1_i2.p1 TRINITY_DN14289_c0_g1~~TRINITY_DN14289_c0_g1_i2.p1  ORF type:complete len:161 (+),score=2.13 TRINITY_DN14289_c0_g1_i2:26-508(+)
MKKIAIVLVGAMSIYGCGGEKSAEDAVETTVDTEVVNNPATAESGEAVVDASDAPAFTFEKEAHDFGTIVQGEKVAYSFKFKNTGKGDLIITSANGSCGCTIPSYPEAPIAPGEEGVIDVVFNSEGKSGQQNKKVTLLANTVPNATVLAINGLVEVPVAE